MEAGYVVDHGDLNTRMVGAWEAGAPEPSVWSGLKAKGKAPHPITTYRCTRCGLLEQYAHAPVP
jgi:hypothetical protein